MGDKLRLFGTLRDAGAIDAPEGGAGGGGAHNAVYKRITSGDKVIALDPNWQVIDNTNFAIDFVSTGKLAVVVFQASVYISGTNYALWDIEINDTRMGEAYGSLYTQPVYLQGVHMMLVLGLEAGSYHIRLVQKHTAGTLTIRASTTYTPALLAAWELP